MKQEKVVCPCRHVTIRQIEQAVHQGATSFHQVQTMTGAAQSCRRCREYAENVFFALLKEYEEKKEPSLF